MSRFKVFEFFGSWILAGLLAGCATSGSYHFSNSQDAPAGQVFLSPTPNFQSPAFLSRWPALPGERDKIRYLLDRVGRANNPFIRNGEAHNGKTARNWILFKSRHWVTGVSTVDDFVNRVASFSMKTGKPYLVEASDGRLYTLRSILRNELQAFLRRADRTVPDERAATAPIAQCRETKRPTAAQTTGNRRLTNRRHAGKYSPVPPPTPAPSVSLPPSGQITSYLAQPPVARSDRSGLLDQAANRRLSELAHATT